MLGGAPSSFSVFLPQAGHFGNFFEPNVIESSKVCWQAVQRKSKRGMGQDLVLLKGFAPLAIIFSPFHIKYVAPTMPTSGTTALAN